MVLVFLADGFEETEALCTLDCLRRARIDAVCIGVTGHVVCGAHGVKVTSDMTRSELGEQLEGIFLPGGMPGTTNLDKSETVEKAINYCVQKKLPIAAICAAPTILGKRGLLDGKKAVCYPGCEGDMGKAEICSNAFVTDGQFTTGASAGCALPFAIEFVRVLRGDEAAKKLAQSMVIR